VFTLSIALVLSRAIFSVCVASESILTPTTTTTKLVNGFQLQLSFITLLSMLKEANLQSISGMSMVPMKRRKMLVFIERMVE
jgi:hypothetical protein